MWESQPNPSTAEILTNAVTFECVDALGRVTALDAGFGYDPTDPYTVSVTFHTVDGDVRWEFGRDLLVEGLSSPAGDGDVHIWPCLDDEGHAVVMVELNSPDGELLAQVPAGPIHQFVARSLSMVPRGTESARLDLDRLVTRLLVG